VTLYDSIGKNYNLTRQPDPRIVTKLISLLDLPTGSMIADIGAGTGNYSNAIAQKGYRVLAIEPSAVMQGQRQHHPDVRWITAKAEEIPLADKTVDGALIMLALHHFNDLDQGIREISRITKSGKLVIFAFEQEQISNFWLTDYFPYFTRDTLTTFPSTEKIASLISQITQKETAIIPFLLPTNLSDLFAASGWCKPKIYLDDQVRCGISTFAKMPINELKAGLKRLRVDIDHGFWVRKYGHLLNQKEYDGGYRILVTK
jgi:ubiquinone/menaquinone biosynthesis C-methylase UbiE